MKDLQGLTDDELRQRINECIEIARTDSYWQSWFRQMHADLVGAYQTEQRQRQTERMIKVVEELTDVIRRKKISVRRSNG